MAEAGEVHVLAADGPLRSALLARIAKAVPPIHLALNDGTADSVRPRDVVVAAVSDCAVERCADLVARGVRVIVLAPVPRAVDEQRYLDAGVSAYIPMTVDGHELINAIQRAVTDATAPTPAPRAVRATT